MTQTSYFPFGNMTITIYNSYKYTNASGKKITSWSRQVIPNCFRTTSQEVGVNGSILVGDAKTSVKIPMFWEYLEPYDWSNLPNDDADHYFTVDDGDLIILREVFDEVDELSVIETIEAKYGSLAFRVGSVNHNYGTNYPLPHIEAVSV